MQEEATKDNEVKDQADSDQNPEKESNQTEDRAVEATAEQPEQAEQAAQEPTVEGLLAAAKEENAKLQDLYMRALAEAENARRRAEESVEKAHKFGVEKFAKNLLPVLDSLEKALELSSNPEDPMMQGVQATYRQFVQAMEKSSLNNAVSTILSLIEDCVREG